MIYNTATKANSSPVTTSKRGRQEKANGVSTICQKKLEATGKLVPSAEGTSAAAEPVADAAIKCKSPQAMLQVTEAFNPDGRVTVLATGI